MVNEFPFGTSQPGEKDYLFRISVCPGNFPVGRTKETFTFTFQPEFPGINTGSFIGPCGVCVLLVFDCCMRIHYLFTKLSYKFSCFSQSCFAKIASKSGSTCTDDYGNDAANFRALPRLLPSQCYLPLVILSQRYCNLIIKPIKYRSFWRKNKIRCMKHHKI